MKFIRYFTIKKILNFLLSYLSFIFSNKKNADLSTFLPFFISVEVSNTCNLHCPECPVGTNKYKDKIAKQFDYEMYKDLINEIKTTLIHVILYFQGEPFLNKQLPDFIKYAHDLEIFTSTSTNGQLINRAIAREIVSAGLDKIIVSIDGTTQETYEKYRVGGSLDKAIKSIEYINFWKSELKSFTPLVEIQFLVLKTNEHQMNDMRRLAKTLHVNQLKFKSAQIYDFENGNDLIPETKKYSRYRKLITGKFEIKGKRTNHCKRLWSGAVVNASGEVLPCCYDKGSEFSFGNINEHSFSEAWHNKKASGFRASILQNRKQHEICRNCAG
jgi:radical SAM protein with 4Fe4S-binding SPASM domain